MFIKYNSVILHNFNNIKSIINKVEFSVGQLSINITNEIN